MDLAVRFNSKAGPSAPKYEKRQCDWHWEKRYPGFKLIHKGYFACLFEKNNDPGTKLLRVSSFQYKRGKALDPKSAIQTMKQETDALEAVWVPLSGSVQHLIVDLVDNGGGNEPMDYYRMLIRAPFQEQYVRFKKIPELEDIVNRQAMMNEDPAQELWFQKMVMNGKWKKLKMGQFTQKTPMFCADPKTPCDEGLFQPIPHSFAGRVSLMVNDGCVSTCDAVVLTLKKYLNAKIYGFYTAADTAYSRLRIDAIRDSSAKDGFRLKVVPQRSGASPDLIVSQDVAVSLSVDEKGQVVSGKALPLDSFVPIHWDQDYHRDVLNVILTDSTTGS